MWEKTAAVRQKTSGIRKVVLQLSKYAPRFPKKAKIRHVGFCFPIKNCRALIFFSSLSLSVAISTIHSSLADFYLDHPLVSFWLLSRPSIVFLLACQLLSRPFIRFLPIFCVHRASAMSGRRRRGARTRVVRPGAGDHVEARGGVGAHRDQQALCRGMCGPAWSLYIDHSVNAHNYIHTPENKCIHTYVHADMHSHTQNTVYSMYWDILRVCTVQYTFISSPKQVKVDRVTMWYRKGVPSASCGF